MEESSVNYNAPVWEDPVVEYVRQCILRNPRFNNGDWIVEPLFIIDKTREALAFQIETHASIHATTAEQQQTFQIAAELIREKPQ